MIIFWEWVFTGSSSPILLPLVAAKLLVFTAECKLLVFKVVVLLWSRGWNHGKLKMSQSSSLLPKFSCFSVINVPQAAANLCSISRALKKLIITVSAIFLLLRRSTFLEILTLPFFFCWCILPTFVFISVYMCWKPWIHRSTSNFSPTPED